MVGGGGPVTVGVDVGTTSVKALAVDERGDVVARVRVPHRIITSEARQLEHDARAAWRRGPRRAYRAVTAELGRDPAGVAVTSMVPSLTAVDRRGVPLIPGLLYGDLRGVPPLAGPTEVPEVPGVPGAAAHQRGGMPDCEGFLAWAVGEAPGAAGYWPCQAVATRAITGTAAVDSAMVGSMGALWGRDGWNTGLLGSIGATAGQMPVVVPMCQSGGTIPGSDTHFAGGTVDALCDQIVSGASEPGDVLAVFGATLVIWIVTDEWTEVPGLITIPHTVPGRVLIGGPSNAGALFVDWALRLLRGTRRPGPGGPAVPARVGRPDGVPVWLPYLRGERTPFNDPELRASLHGLDISQGVPAIARAAYEASGFVIRRMLERAGIAGRRVVASGGGSAAVPWMAGVADATGLPVDSVAVPEGAAMGAAFFARMAAGLEGSLDASASWARTGRRTVPDPQWAKAAGERYHRFDDLGPFG